MVLGKMVSLYLSDREAHDLRAFCDENQCTQYNALKTDVRQLLSKPTRQVEEEIHEAIEEPQEIKMEP